MEPRVLYFTRSGNSERIARKIADLANCGVSRIADDKKWGGIIGFLRGGFYASNKKTTNAQITPEARLSDFSRIVIVGPGMGGKRVYARILAAGKRKGAVGQGLPGFDQRRRRNGTGFQQFGSKCWAYFPYVWHPQKQGGRK